MDDDEIVCSCMSVTRGAIKNAVEAGAVTIEAVQEATGAGTVCGACLDDIESLIKAYS